MLGDRLVFAGPITKASSKQFAKHLQSEHISTLVIASIGGDVESAIDMAELIFQRGIDVEVQVICASSCANYIFLAGKTKTIAPGAVVGWHGNVMHLAYLDRLEPPRSDQRYRHGHQRVAKREADFFNRVGIDGFICWFAKLAPYSVRGTFALSKPDMEYFGVRNIRAPEDYAATDLAPLHATSSERIEFVKVDRASLESIRPPVFE